MPVEDVFTISGRGTIVTGVVERGTVRVGDVVEFVGFSEAPLRTTVIALESFRTALRDAKKGDQVGIVVSGVDKSRISRGMVLAAPGTLKTFSEFKATLYLYPKSEGGRSTPVQTGYRPQLGIRMANMSAEIIFSTDRKELRPGDSTVVTVRLLQPVALEARQEFTVREGGRTVGRGRVAKLQK
ncbi:MAG TPA: EF-Tu/IF-2/RF-3 family GTPase [Chitinophagaceae bacterium]|nr:EF-Tu/IF-2/RF-3 family GTPase [Chitinophagaceae bacterium]